MTEQMTIRPTELLCRRPDFVSGREIILVDGNPWYFAEPRMRLVPSDSILGFEVMLSVDDSGEFDQLMTEYSELAILPPDELRMFGERYTSLEMKLSRMMLERNYNLTTEQLRSILQISHDDEDSVGSAIRKQLHEIIAGDGPKQSADGED